MDNYGFRRATFRPLRRAFNVFFFLINHFHRGDKGLFMAFFLYYAHGMDMSRSHL